MTISSKLYRFTLGLLPTSLLYFLNAIKNIKRYRSFSVSSKSILVNTNLGKRVTIGGGIYIINTNIGDWTYLMGSDLGGIQSYIGSADIGRFCSIGQNLQILDGGHDYRLISTFPFFSYPNSPLYKVGKNVDKTLEKTKIGNDVWIGVNVTIIGGVHIGDGAVIGAGSVVTKDVEPYSIFAGNPAKYIKHRFNEVAIEKLKKIKWWDWSEEKIIQNSHLLTGSNTEALEKTH